MDVSFITPFPEIVKTVISSSILNKAKDRIDINYNIINLFDFLENTNDRIDDYPFGGGNGMILKPAPIFIPLTWSPILIGRLSFSSLTSLASVIKKSLVFPMY